MGVGQMGCRESDRDQGGRDRGRTEQSPCQGSVGQVTETPAGLLASGSLGRGTNLWFPPVLQKNKPLSESFTVRHSHFAFVFTIKRIRSS